MLMSRYKPIKVSINTHANLKLIEEFAEQWKHGDTETRALIRKQVSELPNMTEPQKRMMYDRIWKRALK